MQPVKSKKYQNFLQLGLHPRPATLGGAYTAPQNPEVVFVLAGVPKSRVSIIQSIRT